MIDRVSKVWPYRSVSGLENVQLMVTHQAGLYRRDGTTQPLGLGCERYCVLIQEQDGDDYVGKHHTRETGKLYSNFARNRGEIHRKS